MGVLRHCRQQRARDVVGAVAALEATSWVEGKVVAVGCLVAAVAQPLAAEAGAGGGLRASSGATSRRLGLWGATPTHPKRAAPIRRAM